MKKINYFLALFAIFLTLLTFDSSFSQVSQDWVAIYNGFSGALADYSASIAVDGLGNIYVTGSSNSNGINSDYATIKYNSTGDSVWVRRYNGPGNSDDRPASIAVDGSGNVYVTGYSYGNGTNSDYATIKYHSSGDIVWVKRYNGSGNSFDVATSIAVDVSGSVYVTGASINIGTDYDFTTIKYNSSGDEQWVQRYNGPGNTYDGANSITVDNAGKVYVTGLSEGNGYNRDYATIKYNSSGDSLWVKRYNGPGNSLDYVNSIAADISGNVFVTGSSIGSGTAYDYSTIKYNSSGDSVWVARYDGGENLDDGASSIAVDSSGNVYVTGSSAGSESGLNYATIKYNSSGEEQWVQRYNGPGNSDDGASSIAVDALGNVYVTGYSNSSAINSDFATIKYNSSGDSVWSVRYNGPENYSDDKASSIAVDVSGHVFVTGAGAGNGTGSEFVTIKYSQSTGISQLSSEIPEQYILSQNYPNPFNPTTNLEFGILDWGFVTLKIYDVMGREIQTLVNERLAPGMYNYQFSTVNYQLPSGVYFYRLTAGEFTDTKRMILLK